MSSPTPIELVAELESLWVDPDTSDMVVLHRMLADRQRILTCIQNADAAELQPGVREALMGRLRAVRDRDQLLLESAQLGLAKILDALEEIVLQRTAARGYKPAESEAPHTLERLA